MSHKFSEKIKHHLGNDYVIVIEPTPTYRNILKIFFNEIRVKNVIFFHSVIEAQRFMLVNTAGLIMVEKKLSITDGLKFFQGLRLSPRYGSIPFILMATERLQENLGAATERGIEDFLMKPFSFSSLSQQIYNLLVNAKNPSNFHALMKRAHEQLKCGDLWVAEALMLKAEAMRPESASVACAMAQIAIANQDYVAAVKKLELATSLNPHYLWTREIYRQLLQQQARQLEKKGA